MNRSEYVRCFLSELGHNNFWYPTRTAAIISPDCEYTVLAWISGDPSRSLTPVKVLKSCILPLEFNKDGAKNMAPPEKDTYTVVWINK